VKDQHNCVIPRTFKRPWLYHAIYDALFIKKKPANKLFVGKRITLALKSKLYILLTR